MSLLKSLNELAKLFAREWLFASRVYIKKIVLASDMVSPNDGIVLVCKAARFNCAKMPKLKVKNRIW